MKLILGLVCIIFLPACSDDIKCEPDANYYKLFKGGKQPSYEETSQHMICYDSDGNVVP